MIDTGKDIFSALGKYNSAVNENYLTEAFVFLLNFLLENERSLCLEILRSLCVNDKEYHFTEDEALVICTQTSTEQGRPDIKISSLDKLIYIEIKHDSGLGHKQIERYKKALSISNAPIKKVILLTRFPIDFNTHQEKPYKHIRWFEIANWISQLNYKNLITEYLIKSFLTFLEGKNMTVQKISWEYINGFSAFKNLVNMLTVAAEATSLKLLKSAGWGHTGVYIENSKVFCGIYHDKPLSIIIEAYGKKNKVIYSASLSLEDVYFFSLSKDEQLDKITEFIKEKYKKAKKVLIVDRG
jgi:hypothetical protein